MKNRFSQLLGDMLKTAAVKHYVLADYLGYDTTYISKWVGGHMIPSDKNADEILEGISLCLTKKGTPEGLLRLAGEYGLKDASSLQSVLYMHLTDAYLFVKELQKKAEVQEEEAEEEDSMNDEDDENTALLPIDSVIYYPELSVNEYLKLMRHPVLYEVSDLHVVCAADFFHMAPSHRLAFFGYNDSKGEGMHFPGTRFDVMMNLDESGKYVSEQVIFITSMMLGMEKVELNIYHNPFAQGKLMFVVKDTFSLTAMMVGENQCLSAVVCEDENRVYPLYKNLHERCTGDALLFRRRQIDELINSREFLQTMIERNQRWVCGQVVGMLLPEDLVSELITHIQGYSDEIRKTMVEYSRLVWGMMKQSTIRILIYDIAIYELGVKGIVNFHNHTLRLTYAQRLRVLDHIKEIVEHMTNAQIRMVRGRLHTDFRRIPIGNIILTEHSVTISRNTVQDESGTIMEVNRPELQRMYHRYFEESWNSGSEKVVEGQAILDYIEQIRQIIEPLSMQ